MPKPTQQDLLAAGLRALGARPYTQKNFAKGYLVFEKLAINGRLVYYFVGKAGALRFTLDRPNITQSISLNETTKANVLREGLSALRPRDLKEGFSPEELGL